MRKREGHRAEPDITSDGTFYSLKEAARLAGITRARLRRWVRMGVATPSRELTTADSRRLAEGFSLSDVGYLHLLKHLVEKGVPFERAVLTLHHFFKRFGPPGPQWREAIVSFRSSPEGKQVVAYAPDEWLATLAIPGAEGAGQRFFDLLEDLLPVGVSLESLLVPKEYLSFVEIDPRKADGLPVVRGTRIRTSDVRVVAERYGVTAVTQDYYPAIRPEAVGRVIEFEHYLDRAA